MSARILVVDDAPVNVRLLHAKLTAEYFDVVTAEDGPSALAVMEVEPPDIVLLDVMMPGMTGFEVCRRIKADPRWTHIPVVMVTALDLPEDRVEGLEAGADEFLTKPVNDLALFARVRSLVRLKRLMDEWRMRHETSLRLGSVSQGPTLVEERGDGARVALVAEDERLRARASGVLPRDSHDVILVQPGPKALDDLIRQQPDIVVVDLDMKSVDGLRIASQMRSSDATRHLPLLILGRQTDQDRLIKGLELGVNDYLLKPLEANELRARVRTQVRRRRFQLRMQATHEASLAMALTDSLTGLYNRHYFNSHFDGLFKHAREAARPLSVLMLDVDRFKTVNDTYGHSAGDEVLKELANRIVKGVRSFDMVARLGGEELVIVMPETRVSDAERAAERLRRMICDRPFDISAPRMQLPVSVSIGVSGLDSGDDAPDVILRRADEALYEAKRTGRNRVVMREPAGRASQAALA